MPDDLSKEIVKEMTRETIIAAKEFAGKLISPSLEEGGGLIKDTIKYWRFKNQVNILLKAKEFLSMKGLEPSRILPKTLIPLLENASLEEDEAIQNKWATLLANAAREDIGYLIKPSYAEILNELSPIEVKILDYIYHRLNENKEVEIIRIDFTKKEILSIIGDKYSDDYYLIIDNLFRLNLLQPTASGKSKTTLVTYNSGENDNIDVALRTSEIVSITYLGLAFIKACNEM